MTKLGQIRLNTPTKHYWEYDNEDKVTRRKFNVGDIKENAAECGVCGEYIRSNNRFDYRQCKCGNVAVDGGSWYAKRNFKTPNYKDIIVMYPDLECKCESGYLCERCQMEAR